MSEALQVSSGGANLAVSAGGGFLTAAPATVVNILASAISGISGWWNASSAPAAGYSTVITSLADLSASGNNMTFTTADTSQAGQFFDRGMMVIPRLNGLLGGLMNEMVPNASPQQVCFPFLNMGSAYTVSSYNGSSSTSWTRYLVFSRPNRNQRDKYGEYGSGPYPLVCFGANVLLSITNNGDSGSMDTLTLFPGTASSTVLKTGIPGRFTYAVALLNNGSTGKLDCWLHSGGTGPVLVASAVTNPYSGSAGAWYLGGTSTTGSQMVFHEMAFWERYLTGADLVNLLTAPNAVVGKWNNPANASVLGPRKGIALVYFGQSNFMYEATSIDAVGVAFPNITCIMDVILALRYQLGAISVSAFGYGWGQPMAGFTWRGGTPEYDSSTGTGFLIDNGGPPSTWARGLTGIGAGLLGNYFAAQPDLASQLVIPLFRWSESQTFGSDGTVYGTGPVANFVAAMNRIADCIRFDFNPTLPLATAQALTPIFITNSYSFAVYGITPDGRGLFYNLGIQGLLAGNKNFNLAMANMSDVLPMGSTQNMTTGTFTDGVGPGALGYHFQPGPVQHVRMAATMGPTLIKAGYAEGIKAIPAGIAQAGGPKIVHAKLETTNTPNTVLLTIQHDAGTDINMQWQALAGVGCTVLDGVTPDSPGGGSTTGVIQATAAARVDATHVRVTLASSPANPAASCLFYYSYGMDLLGSGNAIYDNYSTVTKPAGWDSNADLGTGFAVNFPLQPCLGLPLSST